MPTPYYKLPVSSVSSLHTKCYRSLANPAQISSMIGPEFPPSPKEGSWLGLTDPNTVVGISGGEPTLYKGVGNGELTDHL